MAIRHHSTKLCDYLIQATDGKFTLAGTFLNVQAPSFPFGRPIGVQVELAGETGDAFKVILEGPDAGDVSVVLAEGMLQVPPTREFEQWTATVVGQMGINFAAPGVYHVILKSGERIVHDYPFGVFQVQGQQ